MSSLTTSLFELPLFPLPAVLFPGGFLPLKIFEIRYLDMTRSCLRDNTPFGVCLLKSGPSVAQEGAVSVPETVGCIAQIVECNSGEFGMLYLHTRGTHRFRLLSHWTESNGLLVGIAEPVPPDTELEGKQALTQFGACAEVLERIVNKLHKLPPDEHPFIEPFHFDNPSWVANRLAEILPTDLRTRQKWMELTNANARISAVHQFLHGHGWL